MSSALPAISVELIHEATLEYYDAVNERIEFPARFPQGLIAHFAGMSRESLAIVMIWRSEDDALRHIGSERLDGVKEVRADRGVDFQSTRTIATLEEAHVDAQLAGFAADGAIDDRKLIAFVVTGPANHSFNYYTVNRNLGFPQEWPESMLAHAAGGNATHWTIFDAWESSPVMHSHYERVNAELEPLGASGDSPMLEIVPLRLHTMFVDPSAPELADWAHS